MYETHIYTHELSHNGKEALIFEQGETKIELNEFRDYIDDIEDINDFIHNEQPWHINSMFGQAILTIKVNDTIYIQTWALGYSIFSSNVSIRFTDENRDELMNIISAKKK